MAHSAAHIQLSVRTQRQIHMGLLHIAPDIPLVVGNDQHGAQRAVSLDLERQASPAVLQGISHHGSRRQGPPQGRCGHRQGRVDLTGTLGEIPAGDRHSLYHAVGGDCANKLIHGKILPFSLK